MSSENSNHLAGTINEESLGLTPTPFEGATTANQRYRQTVGYEMNLLYTKIALESLTDNIQTSKELAKQSFGFFESRIKYIPEENKSKLEKISVMLDLIIKDRQSEVNVDEGLTILESLSNKTKVAFDEAKNNYYKMLT